MKLSFVIFGRPLPTANMHMIITNGKTGRPMVMRTQEARKYLADAVFQLKGQRRGTKTIEGDVELHLKVYRAQNSGDIDNYAKAIMDALTDAKVYVDDKQVQRLLMEKFTDKKNPRVEVFVQEAIGTQQPLFPLTL